jgi:hypothetical protein
MKKYANLSFILDLLEDLARKHNYIALIVRTNFNLYQKFIDV